MQYLHSQGLAGIRDEIHGYRSVFKVEPALLTLRVSEAGFERLRRFGSGVSLVVGG